MKIQKNKHCLLFLILIFSLSLFLSGCGDDIKPLPDIVGESVTDSSSNEQGGVSIPDNSEFSNENLQNGIPIIGVREVKDGMFQSYLTGEWKSADVSTRRPFAFMTPNNKSALPQYGISHAGIVFEAPVEGRVTRLMVVVEDYDDLDRIGPARSARDYYIYEAMGKEAIFCNWGLTVLYCADLINSDRVDNISYTLKGIKRGADEAFKRITRPGYASEFTGYMIIDGYVDAVNRFGYNPTYSSGFTPQFVFAAANTRVEYDDKPDAKIIRPGGTGNNSSGYGIANPSFEYNEDDGLYYRFQFGDRHLDEMNNQQLTYTNVIYQYTYGEVRDPNDYLAFQMHDTGKPVKVFTNGKVVEGTWSRTKDAEPARYYDNAGYEIVLNQGKTWICLIWDEYGEYAVYE